MTNLVGRSVEPDTPDPVSPELRAVESEIDGAFRESPLVSRPFAESCWYYLAVVEDTVTQTVKQGYVRGDLDERALADHVVVHSKIPVGWLKQVCPSGGQAPATVDWHMCASAQRLQQLGEEYFSFETAFTWATLGHATLAIDGATIRVSGPLVDDAQFDAYDRLADRPAVDTASERQDLTVLSRWLDRVQVKGSRFEYRLSRRDAREIMRAVAPAIDQRFALPPGWTFDGFTLGEFAEIAKALWTVCYCHHAARISAIARGAAESALLSAVLLTNSRALRRRLVDLTNVSESAVDAVVDCLTYGAVGQKTPDPALQPIIALGSHVAVSPSIVASSSLERNMSVLLNRMPASKARYGELSKDRETLLRREMENSLAECGLRTWAGSIPSWGGVGELDVVVIDDAAKCVLLLELKSFVGPAEPREIRDRSEEIAKGVRQVKARREMSERRRAALEGALAIDSEFRLCFAVASKTSIGSAVVQDVSVPVVNAAHLLRKIRQSGLMQTADWLDSRAYLPVEGTHYLRRSIAARVGAWTLEWYGIEVLEAEGLFLR
jgi:hypothetical protein